MKLKTTFRLTTAGLAGYGGYNLWARYRARVDARFTRAGMGPSVRQIRERSELSVDERAVGSDDPIAQATALLIESDERGRMPRTADGIEHRRSQDTVEL